MSTSTEAISYTAAEVFQILGLGCRCKTPSLWERLNFWQPRNEECSCGAPIAPQGQRVQEMVIYYGGWELPTLRHSPAGRKYMKQREEWYDRTRYKVKPGYYRILPLVPKTWGKSWSDQCAELYLFDNTLDVAPIPVLVTALLVHLVETGEDLLKGNLCKCLEPYLVPDYVSVVGIHRNRITWHQRWAHDADTNLWLAGASRI